MLLIGISRIAHGNPKRAFACLSLPASRKSTAANRRVWPILTILFTDYRGNLGTTEKCAKRGRLDGGCHLVYRIFVQVL